MTGKDMRSIRKLLRVNSWTLSEILFGRYHVNVRPADIERWEQEEGPLPQEVQTALRKIRRDFRLRIAL